MDILVTCLSVSQRVQPQRDQRRLAGTSFGIGPYIIQVEATPPGRPLALTVTLSSPRSACPVCPSGGCRTWRSAACC